jgi:predicted restriction endonuclease
MHWIDGGKTSLDNTLLLCSAHHRRLHEGGFRIKPNHTGEWYFETAAGKRLCR